MNVPVADMRKLQTLCSLTLPKEWDTLLAYIDSITPVAQEPIEEKEYPSCDLCGSPNVSADAAARWDYEKQEWTTTNVFDKGHSCDDCEDECKITWVTGDPATWEPT